MTAIESDGCAFEGYTQTPTEIRPMKTLYIWRTKMLFGGMDEERERRMDGWMDDDDDDDLCF